MNTALKQTQAELEELEQAHKYFRLAFFRPYPRQREFITLGRNKRERLLMAANRIGKTEVGAYEAAVHLTGLYPQDWPGHRFVKPVKMWAVGVTAQATRDVVQEKLFGAPGVTEAFGTGMIPKSLIIDVSSARGVTDVIDTGQVRHASGGISTITFLSAEKGREKFQGTGLDAVWFDEEPPLDVYSEGLTRIGDRDGIVWVTFTPLKGPTAVVLRFTDEPSPNRAWVSMTLGDVPLVGAGGHLTAIQKAKMEADYPAHERDARTRGIPMLGEGRIFMTPEEQISEAPIANIPMHWKKLWGIDFGIGHPFAAVLALWDADNDVIHLHHCVRMPDAISLAHVQALKRIGAQVPVMWPRDGTERDVHSGEPIADTYRKLGLLMHHEHATWPDGGVSTEAGVYEWDQRERTGRLKVAYQLSDWFDERRMYHRKDGKIVKMKDDLMSATRILIMMRRFARACPVGSEARPRSNGQLYASGIDFELT